MYLLYVDNDFISSADIKDMVDQSTEETDIINCFSTATLLRAAERLNPEIIIVDLELVKDRLSELFSDLRAKSEHSHVMALINPENYDKLNKAIEAGAVDDYIVKPIRKEEFLARIRIAASKRKGGHSEKYTSEDSFGGGMVLDFDRKKDKPKPLQHEEDDELYGSDDLPESDHEDEFTETIFHGPSEDHPTLEEDLTEDEAQTDEPVEEPPIEEHEFTVKDLLDNEKKTDESYDFDDIMPEESFGQSPKESPEPDLAPESDAGSEEEEGFELFDDFPEPGEPEMAESEEDEKPEEFELDSDQAEEDQLFEEVSEEKEDPSEMFSEDDFIEPVETESKIEESDEEVKDLDDLFKDDLEEEPVDELLDIPAGDKDVTSEEDQSGAASLKPSADFLDDVTLKAPEYDEPAPSGDAQKAPEKAKPEDSSFDTDFDDDLSFDIGPGEDTAADEDDKFFDELFEEKASSTPDESTPFEEPESTPESSAGRKSLREISELPGETADDFLFGDSSEIDEEFEKEKLDELIEEKTFGTSKKREKQEEQGKDKKRKGGFPKFLSILGNVFFVLLLLVMAALSFFLIQSRIAGGVPEVAGYQMYIVLSGSMSPEFDTGSLAFVQEVDTEELAVGDIITYRSSADSDSLTTHRIVEIIKNGNTQFVTRGDANNVNDPVPVLDENVVGQVTGSVPYVGYALNFVQTRQGLILLIFVPGVLIIIYELGKIMKYLTQGNNGKDKKEKGDSGDTRLVEQ